VNTPRCSPSSQLVATRRIWLYSDEFEALSLALESVVDSLGKLDLVVELYRCSPDRRDLRDLCRQLQLDHVEALEALVLLRDAGLIALDTMGDDMRWWFDPRNSWRPTIECLSELHEIDRDELIALMKHVAVQHLRAPGTRSSLLSFAKRKRGNDADG